MTEAAADIVRLVEERKEFMMDVDGYIIYWPSTEPCTHSTGGTTGGGGAYSSYMLRAIADELDRRNAAWDVQVRHDLERLGQP